MGAVGAASIILPGAGAEPLLELTSIELSGGSDGAQRKITSEGRLVSRIRSASSRAIVFPIPCPADIAVAGAVAGYDGQLDNNDFVVFITEFLDGCD